MGTRSEAAWEDRPRNDRDNPWTGGYVGQAYKSDVMENFLHDSLDIAKRTVKEEVTASMRSGSVAARVAKHRSGSDPGRAARAAPRPAPQRKLPPMKPALKEDVATRLARDAAARAAAIVAQGADSAAYLKQYESFHEGAESEVYGPTGGHFAYATTGNAGGIKQSMDLPKPTVFPYGQVGKATTKKLPDLSAPRGYKGPSALYPPGAPAAHHAVPKGMSHQEILRRAQEEVGGVSHKLDQFAAGHYDDDAMSMASSRTTGTNAFLWKKGPGSVAGSVYPSTAVTSRVDSVAMRETMDRLERLESYLKEEKDRRKQTEDQLLMLKNHLDHKGQGEDPGRSRMSAPAPAYKHHRAPAAASAPAPKAQPSAPPAPAQHGRRAPPMNQVGSGTGSSGGSRPSHNSSTKRRPPPVSRMPTLDEVLPSSFMRPPVPRK